MFKVRGVHSTRKPDQPARPACLHL